MMSSADQVLPCRIKIAGDEALDSYLERLCTANGLRTSQLLNLLIGPVEDRATLAFFLTKPDPRVVQRIANISGLPAAVVSRTHDFRSRERRVATLAKNSEHWFERWRTSTSPARRPASLPYAITWMWCEVAQGCLGLSPGWIEPVTHRTTQAYRVFREKIPPTAQQILCALVLDER